MRKHFLTVHTKHLGSFNLKKKNIIKFPYGVVRNSNLTDFFIIKDEEPFSWLQAVNDPDFAIPVIDSFYIGKDYQITPQYNAHPLNLKTSDEFIVLIPANYNTKLDKWRLIISRPIYINLRNNLAIQTDSDMKEEPQPLWDMVNH